jgi:AcrR family transcriptional regulator
VNGLQTSQVEGSLKTMPTDHLDATAQQILTAATKRFLHYGYSKTTMSEIAKDCNMSTGNLYRYFPSKLDIAETFVRVLRREQIAKLRLAVEEPGVAPAERLRRFLRMKFKLAYDRFHDRPMAYELATQVILERPEVALQWEAAEGEVIAEILTLGETSGDFAPGEATRLPRLVQDIVYRFTTPAVFHEGDFDALSKELDALSDLLLDALSWRREHASTLSECNRDTSRAVG